MTFVQALRKLAADNGVDGVNSMTWAELMTALAGLEAGLTEVEVAVVEGGEATAATMRHSVFTMADDEGTINLPDIDDEAASVGDKLIVEVLGYAATIHVENSAAGEAIDRAIAADGRAAFTATESGWVETSVFNVPGALVALNADGAIPIADGSIGGAKLADDIDIETSGSVSAGSVSGGNIVASGTVQANGIVNNGGMVMNEQEGVDITLADAIADSANYKFVKGVLVHV